MKRNTSEPAAESNTGNAAEKKRVGMAQSGRMPGNNAPIIMLVGFYLMYLAWGIYKNKLDGNTSMSMTTTIISAVLMALAGVGVIVYAGIIWKRAADDAQAKADAAAAEEARAAQEAADAEADNNDDDDDADDADDEAAAYDVPSADAPDVEAAEAEAEVEPEPDAEE